MLEDLKKELLKLGEIKEGREYCFISPTLAGIIISLKKIERNENFLILCPNEEIAESIKKGIGLFFDESSISIIKQFPISPYEFVPQPFGIKLNIILSFYKFRNFKDQFLIIVAPYLPYPFYNISPLKIKEGEKINYENLSKKLNNYFYRRNPQVKEIGEFSLRGCIIDIFSPNYENPLRIKFSLDEIENIKFFDKESQRSIERIKEIEILPLDFFERGFIEEKKEYFSSKITGFGGRKIIDSFEFPEIFSIFSHNKTKRNGNFICMIYNEKEVFEIWNEKYSEILERANFAKETGYFDLSPEDYFYAPNEEEFNFNCKFNQLFYNDLSVNKIKTKGLGIIPQDLKTFKSDFLELLNENYKIYLLFSHPSHERILKKYLENENLSFPVFIGKDINENIVLPDLKIALISSKTILGEPPSKYKIHIPKDFSYKDEAFLKGDRVVHVDYGIGIYEGLFSIEGKEYAKIRYSDGYLYIPVENLYLLSPYPKIENPPPLDFIGKQTFAKKKKKVQKELKKILKELLELYAIRKITKGISHHPDGILLKEVIDRFPYEETEDQLKVWEEVKLDMEEPYPMDRLIAGDAGFGKTEIAIRASVKAVEGGWQVAILCPTTLLAFQHFRNFKERLKNLPIEVAWLSRFLSKSEQKKIIERVKTGEIDILIGTHRLLSKDLHFKKLGLLIIDEEQRFGVNHKEKIRILKKNIDTLTLTATPIPRTFNMTLLGLKSISLIGTPPPGRFPVETAILKFNPNLIKQAIEYEVKRGGQVYFVHNRIETLDKIYQLLKNLTPNVRFVVTHGQMAEKELEENMIRFVKGEVEGLLTTTIIENGIDIPRANTLIINNAQNFGLAQLYQLRGRVGRSDRQAFCYLLIPPDEKLPESAVLRLKVLEEFTSLGSGFKVAARDFEMRGAGLLLGKAQSGHMEFLGYDMYLRLIEKTINELKGIEEEEEDIEISLKLKYEIPKEYISEEPLRLKAYRMLLEKEPEKLNEIFTDLFGPPPEEVKNLIEIARLRKIMKELKIKKVEKLKDKIAIKLRKDSKLSFEKLLKLVKDENGRFTPDGFILIPAGKEGKDLLYWLINIFESLK